jgi:hypothetical protein
MLDLMEYAERHGTTSVLLPSAALAFPAAISKFRLTSRRLAERTYCSCSAPPSRPSAAFSLPRADAPGAEGTVGDETVDLNRSLARRADLCPLGVTPGRASPMNHCSLCLIVVASPHNSFLPARGQPIIELPLPKKFPA